MMQCIGQTYHENIKDKKSNNPLGGLLILFWNTISPWNSAI